MRFPYFKPNINWKYVFGEIFLIFVGINLAIWFNNWNTSKHTRKAKKIAIEKITEEIQSNNLSLEKAYQNSVFILNALNELKSYYKANTSSVLMRPKQMASFQQNYPHIYRVDDSIAYDSTRFIYNGNTMINLELIELTEIAWETTKTIEVLNEFGYECLYDLEGMYNLQRRVQGEIDKSGDALQKGNLKALERILGFCKQLEKQLSGEYKEMLENIHNCK